LEKGVVDNDFDTCMFEVEDDADEDAYLDSMTYHIR